MRVSETKHLLLRRLSTRATISGTRDSSSNDKRIRITRLPPRRPVAALSRFSTFQVRRGCRCLLPGRSVFGENGDFIKLPGSRSGESFPGASSVSFFKRCTIYFSLEESESSEEGKWILFQSTGW